MERLAKVLKHFEIPGSLCVNKGDLNPVVSGRIRKLEKSWA